MNRTLASRLTRRAAWTGVVWAALVVLGAAPARAASLQKVDQSTWSTSGLPSYVNMYIYVPDKLASQPPILVASHHCGGSANSTYSETQSTFVALADKIGFLIIFPEATGHNCWDVGSAKSLQHDGGGDTHAIAQMVRYAISKYAADPKRIYAFGTSSGAMMTEALLGVYPDMFIAGVSVAGVPCGCWAEQYSGDSGANPQWSGPCAGGNVTKTAQQWGDLVRSMDPGYTGHRPRVQLWHGTADTTISFKNLGESVKEWTNVLQLDPMPTTSDTAKSGYTHQTWKNSCGYVSLETWAQQGAGHNVSWDAASAESFLGLDRVNSGDPETIACGGSGPGGASGSGGSSAGHGGPDSGAGGSGGATTPAGSDRGASGMAATAAGAVAAVSGSGGDASGAVKIGPTGGGGAGGAGTNAATATAIGQHNAAGMSASSNSSAAPAPRSDTTSSSGCSCIIAAGSGSSTTTSIAFSFWSLVLFMRRSGRKTPTRRS